jgi:ABC-2 type transport system permease protein
LVRLALAHARAETLQLMRLPAYSLSTLAFPAVLMLVLGQEVVGDEPERLLAGFAATAVLAVAFFQFGVGIATSRMFVWERYLRTLPVSPGARLAGRLLSALAFATAAIAVLSVVGVVVYDVRLSSLRWVALVAVLLAGAVPLVLLGIALGYWLPPRSALPLANLIFLPFAIGGGLWQRPKGIPHEVDVASQAFPTRSWMEVLEPITSGDSVPAAHVAALGIWSLGFGMFARWGFRRDEGERFS